MTTLRGVVRSYGAAVRRAERDQQRRAKEAATRFKQQQKHEDLQNATQAVSDWNEYVNMLKSVHKNCTELIDWDEIKNTPKPIEPTLDNNQETLAKKKLDSYKPSLLDKVFGSTNKKIANLQNQLNQAKDKDKKDYELALKQFEEETNNWIELSEIAKGVHKQDPKAYENALIYFDPFSDISELGARLSFSFNNNNINIDLHINDEGIIPNYELKQTSTGKLSKKDMSKSNFNELYQDHICSAVLRVAREVFAYLPIEQARINAIAKLLNSKTGYIEDKPVLSVIIPPATINSLNLDSIDPSDSMKNFVHNMNFKKTTGFIEIQKVALG